VADASPPAPIGGSRQRRSALGWTRLRQEKLEHRWSPEQIAGWLQLTYYKRPEMQVSHESLYRTLYVQSRSALHKGTDPDNKGLAA
jgi:IS30 family transposase